jgi:putative hemolysin
MTRILLETLLILVLLIANGLFAMAEIAIVSARRARLQKRAEQGDRRAAVALVLAKDPDDFLSTVQVGITLVGILAGVFGGATIAEELGALLNGIGAIAPHGESTAVVIVVAVITFLSVVMGELVPKRIALSHPEAIASIVARPMQLLSRWSRPVVALLSASASGLMHLLPVRESKEPTVTDEELTALLALGTKAGAFHPAEEEMVRGVLTLGDRRARMVMTHRQNVTWLDVQQPVEELRSTIIDSGYSRFPVCQGALDQLVGIVELRDILRTLLNGSPLDLRALVHPPVVFLEHTPAVRILEEFHRLGAEFAVIVDEYGSIEGIVTMDDLAQTILGRDEEEAQVVERADGSWLVDGMMKFDEFFEQFHLPGVRADDHETLAGFLIAQLGRLPRIADRTEAGEYLFEIVDMDGQRIDRVAVTRRTENDS